MLTFAPTIYITILRPESAKIVDEYGNTPLHLALEHYDTGDPVDDAVVSAVLKAWPAAFSARTPVLEISELYTDEGDDRNVFEGGKTPLHCALECDASILHYASSWDILKECRASEIKDSEGNTPLHYAMKYNVPSQWILDLFRLRQVI